MDRFSVHSHIFSQFLEKPQCLQCLMDEIAPEQAGLGGVSSQEGRRLRENRPPGGSSSGRVSRVGGQDMSREQVGLQWEWREATPEGILTQIRDWRWEVKLEYCRIFQNGRESSNYEDWIWK